MKFGNVALLTAAAAAATGFLQAARAEEVLYRCNFEEGAAGWDLPKKDVIWRTEAGVGRGGSQALVWARTGTNQVKRSARVPIPALKPGMLAEAEAWLKIVDCPDASNPNINFQWNDRATGAWGGGESCLDRVFPPKTKCERARYKAPERDAAGWIRVRVRLSKPLPPDAAVPYLYLGVEKADAGRVLFDDVVVRLTGVQRVVSMASSVYRDEAFDGDVTFAAGLCTDPDDGMRAIFTYLASDGSVKSVPADFLTTSEARLTRPVAAFAKGTQTVALRLVSADGRECGRTEMPFTRLDRPVVRRVRFDRFGRTVVNGKLFFPLGMYWHDDNYKKHPELLDHYAAGPFNCLQTYDSRVTVAEMDAFWKKGLYVLPSVHEYYINDLNEPYRHPPKGVVSYETEVKALTDYVNSLKDHPAFLAWYTCSEMSKKWHARFKSHADLIRRLDPEHPHFACFTDASAAATMIDCYHVTGIDIYSVRARGQPKALLAPDCADVWSSTKPLFGLQKALYGFRPLWQIPQAFAWKRDYPEHPECDFPTAKEFRSMCWHHIAAGANGLFLYAYGQMVDREWGTPLFARDWYAVTNAAAEVKAQIPVLLKDPGPQPTAVPAKTLVRTWRDGTTVFALVCNTHAEPRTVTVALPGVRALVKTRIAGGVTLKDGALALDMPPFGVALVELER